MFQCSWPSAVDHLESMLTPLHLERRLQVDPEHDQLNIAIGPLCIQLPSAVIGLSLCGAVPPEPTRLVLPSRGPSLSVCHSLHIWFSQVLSLTRLPLRRTCARRFLILSTEEIPPPFPVATHFCPSAQLSICARRALQAIYLGRQSRLTLFPSFSFSFSSP